MHTATKTGFPRRILSAALALALTLGMLPLFSLNVLASGKAAAPQEGDQEQLTVFFTSDFHGAFAGKNFATGAAHEGLPRVAAQLKSRQEALDAAGQAYLTIDVGDSIQGAGSSGFIGNDDFTFPVIKGFNYIGYDAVVPGNHEFNFGVPALLSAYNGSAGTENVGFQGAKLMGNAFKYEGEAPSYVGNDNAIAALPESERDPLIEGFQAYEIFERNGMKVAVIGMTNPGSDMWDGIKLEEAGVYTESAISATKRALAAIEAGGGADIIVLAGHMSTGTSFGRQGSGASSVLGNSDIASSVHVFLGGHGHNDQTSIINGVRYAENNPNGSTFGEIKINAVYEGGKWVVKNKSGTGVTASLVAVSKTAAQDPGYLAHLQPEIDFAEDYAKLPIGELINADMVASTLKGGNAAYVEPTKLVSFINEVQMYYAEAEISGACPFSSGVQHLEGPITRGSLIGIYNYDSNTVYRIDMKGAHLKKWMEYVANGQYTSPNVNTDLSVTYNTSYLTDQFSGIEYTVDLTKPRNEKVTIHSVTRLDGTVEEFDPEERYIVAANDYRTTSGILGNNILTEAERSGPDAPVILETDCNRGLAIAPDIISLMIDYIQTVKGGVIDGSDFEKNWKIEPWWETTIENGKYLREQGERLSREGVITVGAGGRNNPVMTVDSVLKGLEISPDIGVKEDVLDLSTTASLVKPGDEFTVRAEFEGKVDSNAAILTFSFDGTKFEYIDFEAAEGAQQVGDAKADEQQIKVTVMKTDYNLTSFGELKLRARKNAALTDSTEEITLTAEYVVKIADGNKAIKKISDSVSFTTTGSGGDTNLDTNGDGNVDLIDLSNIIDWFSIDDNAPQWNDVYAAFDYDNSGMIDILDIAVIAKAIVV